MSVHQWVNCEWELLAKNSLTDSMATIYFMLKSVKALWDPKLSIVIIFVNRVDRGHWGLPFLF